jgi:5,10-methylenetetrahydrofolate reductase
VLIGEHIDDPDDHIPHRHAERLTQHGLPGIVTLTGRTRTVQQHVDEIDRLVAAGAVAVHCVTGDHPAARFGPGSTAEFTLDGTQLASLARDAGAHVSVAESPSSPPRDARPGRVLTKQHAGADVAILNHGGSAADLIGFADACRATGAEVGLVAPVPVITDAGSAQALARFPGLLLPRGIIDEVLGSSDPQRTGIDLAIGLGRELLASGRFAAVNLSGSATAHGPMERARIMAEVAQGLGTDD